MDEKEREKEIRSNRIELKKKSKKLLEWGEKAITTIDFIIENTIEDRLLCEIDDNEILFNANTRI